MFSTHAYSVLDKIGNAGLDSRHDQPQTEGAKSSGKGLLRVPAQASSPGTPTEQVTVFSVEQALNEHVDAIEEPRLPDGKWHPSSLYGCQRKAVYEVRGREATDPPDERSKRVFRVGHIFHEFAQDAVDRQVGGSVRAAFREVPVEIPELNVVGHADGVVQFETGVWELQEFKSIKSTGFKPGWLPKPDHVGQTTAYMRGLRDHGSPALGIPPLGEDLARARIAYLSKDDLLVSEHTALFTEAKNDDLVLRVAHLEPYRASDTTLPDRLPDEKGKRAWQCKWSTGSCAFFTRCWEVDGDNEEAVAASAA